MHPSGKMLTSLFHEALHAFDHDHGYDVPDSDNPGHPGDYEKRAKEALDCLYAKRTQEAKCDKFEKGLGDHHDRY